MSSEWVAYRVAVQAANGKGVVHGGRPVWDKAVRLALIVDLALRGRVESSSEGSELDTTSTGYAAADGLLAFIDAHPGQSLEWVVKRAPITMLDVVDPSRLDQSRWRRRRPIQLDPADVEWEKQRNREAADSGIADSSVTAATCVLTAAMLLVDDDHRALFIEQCGPAGGLVHDCGSYLAAIVARAGLITAALSSGGGS